MDNQKLEIQLQMALSLPESVRQETMDLNVGYNDADERWTLLIRYVGDILSAESETVQITVLLGGYAVVVLPQEEIEAFSALPQVIYVEKPKRLNFAVYRGAAWKSELLVLRLGAPDEPSFPRTSELMTGVVFLVWTAVQMGKAIAVNISFGNNYGFHDGDSLLSSYPDETAIYGRNIICIGMGNEGSMVRHPNRMVGYGALCLRDSLPQKSIIY